MIALLWNEVTASPASISRSWQVKPFMSYLLLVTFIYCVTDDDDIDDDEVIFALKLLEEEEEEERGQLLLYVAGTLLPLWK